LIFEDRLTGKIKWDPQDLSDLVYRELGSRIAHRQNDVESQHSTMVVFSSGKAVIPDNDLLVPFTLRDGHCASTWNWRMAMISSSFQLCGAESESQQRGGPRSRRAAPSKTFYTCNQTMMKSP